MNDISFQIKTDKEQQKMNDVPALCDSAEMVISNQQDYELGADVLKEIKARHKELDSQRKEITRPIDTAKKAVMDLFRQPLEMLSKAESKVKSLMIGYTNEQERLAEEERKRLQKIADKEAERQKKLMDAKIERAKASGKEEKAEIFEIEKENIIPIAAPVVAPAIETPKGVSYREKFTAEVIDFKILPDEYKLPNQSALDKIVQATKGSLQIPGVKIHSQKVLASR